MKGRIRFRALIFSKENSNCCVNFSSRFISCAKNSFFFFFLDSLRTGKENVAREYDILRNFECRVTMIRRFNDLEIEKRDKTRRMTRSRKFPQTRLRYTFFFKLHGQRPPPRPSNIRPLVHSSSDLNCRFTRRQRVFVRAIESPRDKPDLPIIFSSQRRFPSVAGRRTDVVATPSQTSGNPRRFHPTRYKTRRQRDEHFRLPFSRELRISTSPPAEFHENRDSASTEASVSDSIGVWILSSSFSFF